MPSFREGLSGRRVPPGGQAARAAAARGPHHRPAPGGQDVSQRAYGRRAHSPRTVSRKDLCPPGVSAAKGRLRPPTPWRSLTATGRPARIARS